MDNMDDRDWVLMHIDGQSQLLVAALNTSISGIIITDHLQEDDPIIYCNKAFEEMTGYSQAEVLGKNCRFLQREDREQISRFKIQEAIAEGRNCHIEIANYRKDGTVFFNELYLGPVRNNLGVITHYIGVQNDISPRRLKEASIQLELSNLKKLQQQKDEFTSVAGHELKTPITSLNATLQLMNQVIISEPGASERLIRLSKNAERYTGVESERRLGSTKHHL
ncbi:MAG: PAS domain-containing protein [Chitinophagaceae bacterium]|nr:MAG: PAS domain-containing protein [Chitinophagaceae bacterium]